MRFLMLATNQWSASRDGRHVYPYEVQVSVVTPVPLVALSEGSAHGGGGGIFTVEAALSEPFRDTFRRAEGEWLIPWLERLAAGEEVAEAELVAAFVERHGREPQTWMAEPHRTTASGCWTAGPRP